jgi:hypothetical protein
MPDGDRNGGSRNIDIRPVEAMTPPVWHHEALLRDGGPRREAEATQNTWLAKHRDQAEGVQAVDEVGQEDQ